jgi:hypothetical protein
VDPALACRIFPSVLRIASNSRAQSSNVEICSGLTVTFGSKEWLCDIGRCKKTFSYPRDRGDVLLRLTIAFWNDLVGLELAETL